MIAVPPPAAAGPADEGRRLYEFYCYQCHGYSGNGRTTAALSLQPPPRDLTAAQSRALPRQRLVEAVRDGRPGTGMVAFGSVLGEEGVQSVVNYVIEHFMTGPAPEARYHTVANGWPEHARYAAAFPFATGELALDVAPETLSAGQLLGRRLFMTTCITCHQPAIPASQEPVWEPRAVSFPRGHYDHRQAGTAALDAVSAATPYTRRMSPPALPDGADEKLRHGARLYQENCAFCHAPDGSGLHWIGSFLEPRPRDLTDPRFMAAMTPSRLAQVIRDGLRDSAMPGWSAVLDAGDIAAITHYIGSVFHALAEAPEDLPGEGREEEALPLWVRDGGAALRADRHADALPGTVEE